MTNAQAALIAAASVLAGTDTRVSTITSRAGAMLSWLEAQGAAQEATSAPQADEWRESECRTCGTPLVLLGSRWVGRQDGSTHHRLLLARGASPHEPYPVDRL